MNQFYSPIQMMPAADGWFACYNCEGEILADRPIVMWCVCEVMVQAAPGSLVLVRDERATNEIHGCTCTELGMEMAQDTSNFIGYLPPGGKVEDQPWYPTPAVPQDDHA